MRLTTCLVVLGIVFAGALPFIASADTSAEIRAVEHTGPGVVATEGDRTYITSWQESTVSVAVASDGGNYDVCLETDGDDGSSATIQCQPVESTAPGGEQRTEFALGQWPTNSTGEHVLTVTIHPTGDDESSTQAMHLVTVLAAEGDADGDNLGNEREVERGTSVLVADTDTDGLTDGDEVNRYETDPVDTDTDGDELADGVEANELESNPTAKDTDSDGLDDGAEVTTYGTDPTVGDTDGDSLDDGPEVNAHETNPTTADTDDDGLDDGPEVNVHETDPTAADTDGDGLDDGPETNRYETNPTESDTDGDGLDDGREVTVVGTNPNRGDTDGDGRGDGTEVEDGTDPNSPAGAVARSLGLGSGLTTLVVGIGGIGLVVLVVLGAAALNSGWESRFRVRSRARDYLDADASGSGSDATADVTGPAPNVGAETHGSLQPDVLLDDDDRVLKLLDEHDGQLRQSSVVDETGWSKSKVSRVLSQMDDDGEIRKIALGRENLIMRVEDVPEHARSPFEDR
ncbi:hypothetical protein C440_09998 [Haloferax mucosum ATCC BAA-1512]|uniref:DUF7343 domain-containing protein n=1 Tax=Haloferax mucosum ATCC BAA-1512 TaxID=662479 RepID=M0IEN8_9EURY|nr:helix-turn-helix domain-containing protein [Haloferax mucosum]ELZ94502.1 hypothetical protein C440_09998 [Haloferax mucosum ATCC BAA-1512]